MNLEKFVVNSQDDYPLGQNHLDKIVTATGKKITNITLEAVLNEKISDKDLRISPDTLELQAQVAEKAGRKDLAKNLRRAAELTSVPDDVVLSAYEKLRPKRCTENELLELAEKFENTYGAVRVGQIFREAAAVYKKRNLLYEG